MVIRKLRNCLEANSIPAVVKLCCILKYRILVSEEITDGDLRELNISLGKIFRHYIPDTLFSAAVNELFSAHKQFQMIYRHSASSLHRTAVHNE